MLSLRRVPADHQSLLVSLLLLTKKKMVRESCLKIGVADILNKMIQWVEVLRTKEDIE